MEIDLQNLVYELHQNMPYVIGNKGYYLKGEEYTLSVQIGYGNYCMNEDYNRNYGEYPTHSLDAEIAIWTNEADEAAKLFGNFMPLLNNTVEGWVTAEKISCIIPIIRDMRKDNAELSLKSIRVILADSIYE